MTRHGAYEETMMAKKKFPKEEMKTIVFVDSVNFTHELKIYGKSIIDPKINLLQDFVEFFFVFKMKGEFIGKMGDGFLVLCPPDPVQVINNAAMLQSFVNGFNYGKEMPYTLNIRIAMHYGLISPPINGNYIDTNLNLAARLEGMTPRNSVCISSVLFDIVQSTINGYRFEKLSSDFKGLGHNVYYNVLNNSQKHSDSSRKESRLSYYLSTIDALREASNWEATKNTCEQALIDFPEHPEFLSQLGFALFIADDHVGAIRRYERCIELEYDADGSLWMIGWILRETGNFNRAIEKLTQCVSINPDHYHAMVDLAEAYLATKNFKMAIKWSRSAMKKAPKYFAPWAVLIAATLLAHGEAKAKELFDKMPVEPLMFPEFEPKLQEYLSLEKEGKKYLRLVRQSILSASARFTVPQLKLNDK